MKCTNLVKEGIIYEVGQISREALEVIAGGRTSEPEESRLEIGKADGTENSGRVKLAQQRTLPNTRRVDRVGRRVVVVIVVFVSLVVGGRKSFEFVEKLRDVVR